MKRTLLLLTIALIAVTGATAETGFEIGPTATLKFPFAVSDSASAFEGIGIEDFKFGADIELGLGPLQLGALIDYRPGRQEGVMMSPAAIEAFVTGGLLFDLKLIRIGVGVGPTFIVDIPKDGEMGPPPVETAGDPGDFGIGLGVKANADVTLGPIALRLNVISGLDILRAAAAENVLEYMDLKLGVSLLYHF